MTGTNISSDLQTADAAVLDRRGILTGVQLISDLTNDMSLIIYDNASAATGVVLFKGQLVGTEDSKYIRLPDGGIRCTNGLFADVTGTGAAYIVHYR
jgi:hypothetical protein